MGIFGIGIAIAIVTVLLFGLLEILRLKGLMSSSTVALLFYIAGLSLGLFGLFFSWIWVYYGVLFYSVPALIASGFFTWRAGIIHKRIQFSKINIGVLLASISISVITFFIYL